MGLHLRTVDFGRSAIAIAAENTYCDGLPLDGSKARVSIVSLARREAESMGCS